MAKNIISNIKKNKEIDQLIRALKDDNELVRWNAATSLGRLRDRRALRSLLTVLNNRKGPQVRAAWALGMIGDEAAVRPLVAAFLRCEDSHSYLGPEIVLALNRIHSPKSFGLLVNILKDERKPDLARQITAGLLGRLGDSRATVPLLGVLEKVYRRKRRGLKNCVVYALGEIGDERAIEPLVKILRKVNIDFQDVIIHELGRFGEAAKAPLKGLLKDNNPLIRKAACRTLKRM